MQAGLAAAARVMRLRGGSGGAGGWGDGGIGDIVGQVADATVGDPDTDAWVESHGDNERAQPAGGGVAGDSDSDGGVGAGGGSDSDSDSGGGAPVSAGVRNLVTPSSAQLASMLLPVDMLTEGAGHRGGATPARAAVPRKQSASMGAPAAAAAREKWVKQQKKQKKLRQGGRGGGAPKRRKKAR